MYILNSFFYFLLVEDILWPLVGNRIKVQGFNVMQFTEEYPAARRQIVHWIKEVRVVHGCFQNTLAHANTVRAIIFSTNSTMDEHKVAVEIHDITITLKIYKN